MDSDTRKSRAFSLLELLIVIAILAMLSSVTVAGFNSIVASSRMDLAGRIVVDEIALARQMAVSRNENVLLRFQKQPRQGTSDAVFYRIQAFIADKADPSKTNAVKGAALLPEGVALDPDATLSPLLNSAPGPINEPSSLDRILTFRPNGEMEPIPGLPFQNLTDWCLTLVPERSLGKPIPEIPDFITIQIDPLTSRPRSYRP